MPAKDCPRCGLTSPPIALRCDCGYRFDIQERSPDRITGPPFQASRGLSNVLVILGSLSAILQAASTVTVASLAAYLRSIGGEAGFTRFTYPTVQSHEWLFKSLVVTGMIVGVLWTIVFFVWLYRVYRNLPALGAVDLEFTPGWAVGSFFVPFANLIFGYRVLRELWRASLPGSLTTTAFSRRQRETPLFLKTWWGIWVSSVPIAIISSAYRTGLITLVGAMANVSVWVLIFMVLEIVFVRSIHGNQRKRCDDCLAARS